MPVHVLVLTPEMESSRPWPWTRGTSRTTHSVLGLGLRCKALGLDPFCLVCLVFMLIGLVLRM